MKLRSINLIAASLASVISLQANAQLLNDTLIDPTIDYNSDGTTTFTASNGQLTIDASPLNYINAGGTAFPILNLGSAVDITMNVSLAADCSLVSGSATAQDLIVQGDVIDPSNGNILFSGTLLTAEVTEQGFDAAGDLFDYRFTATGGTLVDGGELALGAPLGLTVNAEGANFNGDCSSDFSGEAKGKVSLRDVPVEPEKCYDVKKLWFQDSVAYRQCYGWGGNYGSKFKVKLAAECENDFDPSNDFISVMLDGEKVEFPPGSFEQDYDNLSKFRAHLSGRPSVSAILNCSEGTFSLIAHRADISQVDFNDGVDVTLTLGDWVKTMNAPVTPHQSYNGYNLTWKYWNPNPADCSNPDYEPPACETQWDSVKFKHIDSGEFFHFDGNFGSEILLNHEYEDDGASCSAAAAVDASCSTAVTCGDVIGGFKVIKIDHKDDSQSCDLTSHHDRYHDRWSWKRRKHW